MTAGWQERAACADASSDLFFPSSTSANENRRLEAQARAICRACPVKVECRDFAQTSNLGNREQHGIWGAENYGPKRVELSEAVWNRPRTLECEICLVRWRWTPVSGYRQPPRTCSSRCLGVLRSRNARARDRHGFERVEAG